MFFNKLHLTIAALFLIGVASWFFARYWTFGNFFPVTFAFRSGLAIALATAVARGSDFYCWFTVAISAALAYSSFQQFFYLATKDIKGEAYILPGAIFSLCSVVLLASLVFGHIWNRQTTENGVRPRNDR